MVSNFTANTQEYRTKLEASARDNNKFLLECKKFCNFDYSDDYMAEMIYKFLQSHQQHIDVSDINSKLDYTDQISDFKLISEFIAHISLYDNDNFNAFKSLFSGFLLKQFISKESISDLFVVKNLTVYADSSFIFRVLDLQSPYHAESSKELLKLMQDNRITVIALKEIIDEVINVLSYNYRRYVADKDTLLSLYSANANMLDGVIGAFIRRGFTNTQIEDLISNLEQKIKDERILISADYFDSNANIRINESEYKKIVEFKAQKNRLDLSKNRDKLRYEQIEQKSLLDAKILSLIRKRRQRPAHRFDKSRFVFLTCDNIVYSVNQWFHRNKGTVPECLNEITFTNTLYMHNPNLGNNVSIKLLISIYQSSAYMNYDILRSFHQDIKEHIEKKPEDSQYIGYVFSNQSLFQYISDAQYVDEAASQEDTFIEEVFAQAKKTAEDEKIKLKTAENEVNDLKKQMDTLKNEFEKLMKANADNQKSDAVFDCVHETSLLEVVEPHFQTEHPSTQQNNVQFESIFKNLIRIICGVLFVFAVAISLPNMRLFPFTNDTDYWLNVIFWGVYPLAVILLFSILHKEGNMQKLVKRFVHGDKTESVGMILFLILLDVGIAVCINMLLPILITVLR